MRIERNIYYKVVTASVIDRGVRCKHLGVKFSRLYYSKFLYEKYKYDCCELSQLLLCKNKIWQTYENGKIYDDSFNWSIAGKYNSKIGQNPCLSFLFF
jgi:hypothetical protein